MAKNASELQPHLVVGHDGPVPFLLQQSDSKASV